MLVNTPPMGWNSWNTFGADISEKMILEMTDKIVKLGLDKVGYKYVVIDDCWSEKKRDPKTEKLTASKKKFPHGMKYVADYVHSKGLKFGMYSCAGVRTCGDYPGSFDHEFLDAKTFAEFGVDFLKYDFCFAPKTVNGPLLYRRMGNALRACGRDILFSACNWGSDDVWSWIRSAGAHMYRSTGDIHDNFVSFTDIAKSQFSKFCYSGNNCFNDMDMLTVGMYGKGLVGTSGCDFNQYKTQFALWCLMGSPLMLGSDLRKITPEILDLIKNPELLKINQDPECRPAFTMDHWGPECCHVLARLLADNSIAIGFFNFGTEKKRDNLNFESIGFPASAVKGLRVYDIFAGDKKGEIVRENLLVPLEPCECKIFKAVPILR